MSGSVAEALLASGSKKLPLLPPPPKRKKEPKTFRFNLELTESTDQSYPEFSWSELVRNAKEKEISQKAVSGNPVLDPFASDDEDDLKAMAAKFEAKYNSTTVPPKKKKRRVEDYIDRGAGYDESDPFIDNSDVYDEVVPPDLQTAHGGFYINSGSLDFKEVELSEDDDDSLSSPVKRAAQQQQPPKKAKVKITPTIQERIQSQNQKDSNKNPVGRPPGVGSVIKRPFNKDKPDGGIKKRRMIVTPIGSGPPDGKKVVGSKLSRVKLSSKGVILPKPVPKVVNNVSGGPNPKDGVTKPRKNVINSSSSSGSGSSDDSDSGSSSSSSSSESSEETEEKEKPLSLVVQKSANTPAQQVPASSKQAQPPTLQAESTSISPASITVTPPPPKPKIKLIPDSNVIAARIDANSLTLPPKTNAPPTLPQKRVKTKNVPLNPKLHPLLPSSTSATLPPPPILSVNNPPPPPLLPQQPQKIVGKDLIIKNSNGTNSLLMNLNARSQVSQVSSSGNTAVTNSTPARVPTPKSITSTPSQSPSGLTISAVIPSPPNPSSVKVQQQQPNSMLSAPAKVKGKKQSPGGTTMPTIATMEILNSINNYSTSLDRSTLAANFSNLIPQMAAASALNATMFKAAGMLGQQKSLPNLKKISPQQGTSDKLVVHQKQTKTPKAVKNNQQKMSPNISSTTPSTSTSLSVSFSGGTATPTSSFMSSAAGAYKTPPPPLAGPGVEISKVRQGSTQNQKSSPSAAIASSSPSLQTATIITSPLTSSAGLASILASPNNLVSSVPNSLSSLTVQRLPQSITITPSGIYTGGSATTSGKAVSTNPISSSSLMEGVKVAKQYTPFDVSALLQGSSGFGSGSSASLIPLNNPVSKSIAPAKSINSDSIANSSNSARK